MYVGTNARFPGNYVFLQVEAPCAVNVGVNDQEQAKTLDVP